MVYTYIRVKETANTKGENNMTKNVFEKFVIDNYGIEGDDQHNKNLKIMLECYFEDRKKYEIEDFAEYASGTKNLDKFLSRGAVIL